jgi:flagellar biogenesis protein FliO
LHNNQWMQQFAAIRYSNVVISAINAIEEIEFMFVRSGSGSMTGYRRRTITFAALLALGGAVVLIDRTHPAAQPINQQSPRLDTSVAPANKNSFSEQFTENLSNQELFFKMTISVILVIALGGAAFYLSKRFLPRITNLPGREIHVLETAYLGSRKAVHLVEVGKQRFLIGSTSETITTLADVTDTAIHGCANEGMSR